MADQADRLRQLVRLARAHEPPADQSPRSGPWGWLGKAAWSGKARTRTTRDARKPQCKLNKA